MSENTSKTKSKLLFAAAAVAITMTASAGKPPDCWMTGGGSIFDTETSVDYTGQTTHGMVLHCDTRNPNKLEINWEGNIFHLTDLTGAQCPDTAGIEPNPPDGRFRHLPLAWELASSTVHRARKSCSRFTDAGEPGTADTGHITIWFEGFQVFDISGPLTFGNHQAHSN